MHTARDYSVRNYRYIKLHRHNLILVLTVFLYFITQLVFVNDLGLKDFGLDGNEFIEVFTYILMLSGIYFINRYRFDYVLYKLVFAHNQKLRYLYTHNLLIGPLFVYLLVVFSGLYGMILLLLLASPGRDYLAFRTNALALNDNYIAIAELIKDLKIENFDDCEEQVELIKYNIGIYNMYEIAIFDNQAIMLDYDQMVAEIKITNS